MAEKKLWEQCRANQPIVAFVEHQNRWYGVTDETVFCENIPQLAGDLAEVLRYLTLRAQKPGDDSRLSRYVVGSHRRYDHGSVEQPVIIPTDPLLTFDVSEEENWQNTASSLVAKCGQLLLVSAHNIATEIHDWLEDDTNQDLVRCSDQWLTSRQLFAKVDFLTAFGFTTVEVIRFDPLGYKRNQARKRKPQKPAAAMPMYAHEISDFCWQLWNDVGRVGFRTPDYLGSRSDYRVNNLEKVLGLHEILFGARAYRRSEAYEQFLICVLRNTPVSLAKWSQVDESFGHWLRAELASSRGKQVAKAFAAGEIQVRPRWSRSDSGLVRLCRFDFRQFDPEYRQAKAKAKAKPKVTERQLRFRYKYSRKRRKNDAIQPPVPNPNPATDTGGAAGVSTDTSAVQHHQLLEQADHVCEIDQGTTRDTAGAAG